MLLERDLDPVTQKVEETKLSVSHLNAFTKPPWEMQFGKDDMKNWPKVRSVSQLTLLVQDGLSWHFFFFQYHFRAFFLMRSCSTQGHVDVKRVGILTYGNHPGISYCKIQTRRFCFKESHLQMIDVHFFIYLEEQTTSLKKILKLIWSSWARYCFISFHGPNFANSLICFKFRIVRLHQDS